MRQDLTVQEALDAPIFKQRYCSVSRKPESESYLTIAGLPLRGSGFTVMTSRQFMRTILQHARA